MKEKFNISFSKLGDLIPEYLSLYKKEGDITYHMKITSAGVKLEDIQADAVEGIIIVDNHDHNIVIEEADRYCPWNRYSTYGFYRSFILPENILVKDVHIKVEGDNIYLGWVD